MQALNEWVKRTIGMRDEEGRPLGEAKAPPERLRGVPLELRTCPYADSRKNHALPMNVSALKQAFAHWDGVLGGIELLRSLYTAEVNLKQIRLIDVWRIGVLTSSIGDFAFLRAENPVGDLELPAPVAAVYKISLGIASTCVAMWADGSSRFDAPADADALYAYADANGQFIGSEQVCAGPLGMVKQTLRLVVDGTGAGRSFSGGPGHRRQSAIPPVLPRSGVAPPVAHGAGPPGFRPGIEPGLDAHRRSRGARVAGDRRCRETQLASRAVPEPQRRGQAGRPR